MNLCYCPILKTTTAEMRGLKNLSPKVAGGTLPILELTRSRRSKHNPDGSIEKRTPQIQDALEDRPFVLDVTTEPAMSNAEIAGMLHGAPGGFKEWVKWVAAMRSEGLDVIPMIHYDPDHVKGVGTQIRSLLRLSQTLAFRASPSDQYLADYLQVLARYADLSQVILILDAEYLSLSNNRAGDYSSHFQTALNTVAGATGQLKATVCAFSSFPDSVVRKHYGEKEKGVFPIAELITHRLLQAEGVVAGDYASVHPQRYNIGGGTWIPRVDFVGDDDKFRYYRYRREKEGYVRAARRVVRDPHYKAQVPPTWGDVEIKMAAAGKPSVKSPVHWIAVRVNLYITRMHKRFRGGNHVPL